jgi:hypothetical protein
MISHFNPRIAYTQPAQDWPTFPELPPNEGWEQIYFGYGEPQELCFKSDRDSAQYYFGGYQETEYQL